MHALGIPTTRALSIVTSDTPVARETVEKGAMLMRIAQSHLRFGHFEHFYYRREPDKVRQLADFAIRHHWAHLQDDADQYVLWFRDVVARTAALIARWQTVGFAHGVMNTDNMSLLGLTFDYGPFGFWMIISGTSVTTPTIRGATVLTISPRWACGTCSGLRKPCRRSSTLMPSMMRSTAIRRSYCESMAR